MRYFYEKNVKSSISGAMPPDLSIRTLTSFAQ